MANDDALNICLVTAELAPLAKTGGLADVCAALAAQLHEAGHDIRVLMPHYAVIDSTGLELTPVDFLQDMEVRVGPHRPRVSIDTATLPGSSLPIYLLRCPELYDRSGIYSSQGDEHLRFSVLSHAAMRMCQQMGFAPDIVHCHDWHAALLPLLVKRTYAWDRLFENTRSVLTIHNIGYQGVFSSQVLPDLGLDGAEDWLHQDDLSAGMVNFMKTGLLHANLLTTVSPTYAREIQGEEYGVGLDPLLRARSDSLFGILNGVDYDEWNPATDSFIPARFSPGKMKGKKLCKRALMDEMELAGGDDRPLVGIVSRLVGQKGIDLMEQVLPTLLRRRDFALAVLGSGESRYEHFFHALQRGFRDQVCFYRGYNNKLAHWIEAGADLFLMPSLYEPCGLNQMYSLKYGTVPIVRETGGLADSVQQINPADGTGTGILFRHYNADGLAWAINAGLDVYADADLWAKIQANGMAQDFSWASQTEVYVRLFRQLAGHPSAA